VAIYGLVETGAINLSFAVVWNYGSSLNLPSWVPDWGSEALLETCCDGTCPLCQDIPPHVSVVGGGWVIRIDGLMIDSINSLGQRRDGQGPPRIIHSPRSWARRSFRK
jgi:hypothetical protein